MDLDFSFIKNGNPKDDQATTPVPVKYDLDAVRALIKSYDGKFADIEERAKELTVQDDDTAATATEMIAQASKLLKTLDADRKEKKKDANDYVRSVDSLFRPVNGKVKGIIDTLKKSLGAYQYKKELKRREDEKRAREAQAAAQAELDKQAKKAGVDSVELPDMVAPRTKEPIRTEIGTASTRTVWTFKILDPAKVPDNYKDINEKKINAAIKAGIREIPGIDIHEKPVVSVRIN